MFKYSLGSDLFYFYFLYLQYFDMAADVMAENAHLTYKFLSPVRQMFKLILKVVSLQNEGISVMNDCDCVALLLLFFFLCSVPV